MTLVQGSWTWPRHFMRKNVDITHTCNQESLRRITRFSDDELTTILEAMAMVLNNPQTLGNQEPAPASSHPAPNEQAVVKVHWGMLTAHQFVEFLGRGIPVQLHGVHQRLQCDWTPQELTKTMKNDMIECIDCNAPDEKYHMLIASDFFARLSTNNKDGKDWPPESHFKDVFNRHYHAFNNAFPPECSDVARFDGLSNLAAYWPNTTAAPDLGPKMYAAMGNHENGKGTTRLHLDVTDAANLLVWAADAAADAALWHIFPRDDTGRLRDAMWSMKRCSRNLDPIFSQTVYLGAHDLKVLLAEYNIRPRVLIQRVGDLIFIPAGCAHQVRNMQGAIKVASDFVASVNVSWTRRMLSEWRAHRMRSRKSDVLQLRHTLLIAWKAFTKWTIPEYGQETRAYGADTGTMDVVSQPMHVADEPMDVVDNNMHSVEQTIPDLDQSMDLHREMHVPNEQSTARTGLSSSGSFIPMQVRARTLEGSVSNGGELPIRTGVRWKSNRARRVAKSVVASTNPMHTLECPVRFCGKRCHRNGLVCHL
ncbi:hypothetical protein C8Q76DRAFT_694681 [Earliella scabrosa]|nr:hypothetical protein C8Q76DRAFT_694681 [Earliella scabrosa]